MRERNNLMFRWLSMLLMLPFLASSCSDDSNLATSNDYCYIRSVTLGAVKRRVELRDADGDVISVVNTTITGSNFAMTINQRDNTIENRDSLPYGCNLSAVLATIAFDGSLLTYRVKDSDSDWLAYNSTDSLDLTKPLELLLFSNDSQSERVYTLKVNVHKQEGDSLYWKKCESEVASLTDMTDMKVFFLNNKMMVLGQKTSGIVLAERSGIEAVGTWEETATTGLPLTADLQTLRQHGGTLYLSTSDGSILTSTDAKIWQQEGATLAAGLTLVEKTDKYYYVLSEGKLLRSADASTWEEEKLDTKADSLPDTSIRALTLQQTNGSDAIVMLGHRSDCTHAVAWYKMWNIGWECFENDAEWMFFPFSPDNRVMCPLLKYLNLIYYDCNCVAFGGASLDNTHEALDAMYVSRDYGITWRPSTEIHLPVELKGTNGCITGAVDKNNYIWLITNAQVWRGRLNRLGFAQQ